ncbi:MAG: hypothetical protein ABIU77_04750 [Ferruginibacter sp.]|jgi:hypothetical protein
MKKIMLSVLSSMLMLFSFCQTNDKMLKHSGETLEVKVIKVGETTISYKYPGEEAEQTIGKFAVASITYGGSGRKEAISEKIVITGKDDWEKVEILTDKSQVLGLAKGEEIKGKTSGLLSYNTAGSADKKATKRIKEAAAEAGAPFILMTSDKSDGFGIKQAIKKGVAYSYK